jgi:predicted dehydrogenase
LEESLQELSRKGKGALMIKGIICGTGRAGTYLHFGAFKAAGAEIVAFVDINEKAAEDAAVLYGINNYYDSLDKALSECGNVDFVDICTSSRTHLQLARTALEKNCNVLIEKPITENLEELLELKKLKDVSKKVVCAVHNHKFYPGMTRLRDMILDGQLGDIISVHREMSFNYQNIRMMEKGHWSHKIPGGRLFEANPHNLYLLYSFLGEMELVSIYPRRVFQHWEDALIDEFQAILKTRTATINLKMSMHCDTTTYGIHGPNFFIVTGTRKSVLATYQGVYDLSKLGKITYDDIMKKFKRLFSRDNKEIKIFDNNGNQINTGLGSGHRWLIERFIGNLSGMYKEEAVPFTEAFYVQKMNLEMGKRLEAELGL